MSVRLELSIGSGGTGGGTIATGMLQLASGVPLDTTLRAVTDQANTVSPLQLSTTQVAILSDTFFGASSSTTNILTLQSTTRNQIKVASGSTFEIWRSAGVESARFDSNGNFVLGTTTASARLHVRGNGTNPIARFENSAGLSFFKVNQATYAKATIGDDSTANYFSLEIDASGNGKIVGNYGLGKTMYIGNGANYTQYRAAQFDPNGGIYNYIGSASSLSGTSKGFAIDTGIAVASVGSANNHISSVTYTINNTAAQSGTVTGIFLNATETALNGMTHNLMDLQVGGVSKFKVDRLGSIIAYNIDAQGSTSVFNAIRLGISSIAITTPSNGVMTLYNGGTNDFNRLQFGGTTNAFPAIKRNGAQLQIRTADDSAYATLVAGVVETTLYFIAGATVLSNGRIYYNTDSNPRFNINAGGYNIEANASGANDASAIFQINSTTKGFLPPRMTTAQKTAIGTPAEGLVVMDTTLHKLCVYSGSAWEVITSV